jgi:hypothetical protein
VARDDFGGRSETLSFRPRGLSGQEAAFTSLDSFAATRRPDPALQSARI